MSAFLFQGKRFEVMELPRVVARCPECGGRLFVQVNEWETETGIPTEGGVEVDCENTAYALEEERGSKFQHRHWQSEWMPVIDKVEAWAKRFIRVIRS